QTERPGALKASEGCGGHQELTSRLANLHPERTAGASGKSGSTEKRSGPRGRARAPSAFFPSAAAVSISVGCETGPRVESAWTCGLRVHFAGVSPPRGTERCVCRPALRRRSSPFSPPATLGALTPAH